MCNYVIFIWLYCFWACEDPLGKRRKRKHFTFFTSHNSGYYRASCNCDIYWIKIFTNFIICIFFFIGKAASSIINKLSVGIFLFVFEKVKCWELKLKYVVFIFREKHVAFACRLQNMLSKNKQFIPLLSYIS